MPALASGADTWRRCGESAGQSLHLVSCSVERLTVVAAVFDIPGGNLKYTPATANFDLVVEDRRPFLVDEVEGGKHGNLPVSHPALLAGVGGNGGDRHTSTRFEVTLKNSPDTWKARSIVQYSLVVYTSPSSMGIWTSAMGSCKALRVSSSLRLLRGVWGWDGRDADGWHLFF